MKRFISQLILLFLFFSFTAQDVHASEITINGIIGETQSTSISQSAKEVEADQSNKSASPKQSKIQLDKFPNTGSLFSNLAYGGLLLLFIVFVMSRWKSHYKQ